MIGRRTLLGAALTTPFLAAAARSQDLTAAVVAGGTVIDWMGVESAHVQPRNVTVWLPPGYGVGDARHPVLYMHDGQNLFDPSRAPFGEWGVDEHLVRLIDKGEVRAPIVVGVWNTPLRRQEYVPADLIRALPAATRSELRALYGGEPLSDGYLRFLVEELKPRVDASFLTLPGRDDTVISGSSMGGLISLYAMMKHPEVFSAAACLSTHWPLRIEGLDASGLEAFRETLVETWTRVVREGLPAGSDHRLYFDRGDETLDQFYAFFQDRIDSTVRQAGWGPERFTSLVFPGAEHNEGAWNQRLDVPLIFLLGARQGAQS
ncbi:alpha/beta hydrolase-fold protein [Brevundimonas sp.]|uniref:alpha/beta hydrolase n=1 Tax=Brevundimonas sp. TaxID=1871086 RepID=UPI0025DCA76F|nr:alpha/beta hydrolase-fold protein [Brevundimonas sp.]